MIHAAKTEYFDLEVIINGQAVRKSVPTHLRLLDFLRDEMNLTGTKEVCGEGECGACTVFLDGITVNSCLIFVVEAHGSEILTIEGLSSKENPSSLVKAFVEEHSVQCGYCIPGMVISGEQILKESENPTAGQIRYGLSGNICRCTGYHKFFNAVDNVEAGRR